MGTKRRTHFCAMDAESKVMTSALAVSPAPCRCPRSSKAPGDFMAAPDDRSRDTTLPVDCVERHGTGLKSMLLLLFVLLLFVSGTLRVVCGHGMHHQMRDLGRIPGWRISRIQGFQYNHMHLQTKQILCRWNSFNAAGIYKLALPRLAMQRRSCQEKQNASKTHDPTNASTSSIGSS